MSEHKNCKKVLIIQLARFGDIIQTCTAVEKVKAKNPDTLFYFLGRQKFTKDLRFILQNTFTEIFELPNVETFVTNDGVEVEQFSSFLEQVNQLEFDEAINLTFSQTAGLLTSLIHAKARKGIYRDSKNIQVFSDPWTCYVHAAVLAGPYNLLNLVDLFIGIITGSISSTEMEVAAYNPPAKKQVFVHPFASQGKKFWSPDRWCEFFFKFLRDVPDAVINILGASSEEQFSEKILSHPLMRSFSERIISHVGKTPISQIPELCKDASLFIGHDSMIGHLISRLNIPSITLALGPVRPEETVPYSAYSLTMYPRTKCFPCAIDQSCSFYQCHYDITVKDLATLAGSFFNGPAPFTAEKGWEPADLLDDSKVNYATSKFSDGWALTNVKTQSKFSFDEVIRILYRMSFLKIINDIDLVDRFPKIYPNELSRFADVKIAFQKSLELLTFGEIYSNQILVELCSEHPSAAALQPLAQRIDEIEGLMLMLTNSCSSLKPLTHYVTSSYSSCPGDSIITQAKITMNAFIEGKLLSQILVELIAAIITQNTQPNLEMEK